ncbi:MAG: zinc ABC transporter substrate-binding protein [Paracoccaceae bacterium]|jgi:zinc transport system substrate-binding protein
MKPHLTALPFALLPALAPTLGQAETPRVVTDIPAVHSLVAQVMAGAGTPEVLLEQGGNAHNYQLKPSQAQALQEADLTIWIGPEMTPWLGRAIAGVSLGGKVVSLLEAPGTHVQAFGAGAHEHGEEPGHDDHAHEGEDDHAEDDGHDHDGTDPHAWLDPQNGRHWLGVIAAELAALDPAQADLYAANATAAAERLAALDARLGAQLAPVAERPFVVFHDAYGYFNGHYGLHQAGAVALGDAAAPGAAHLADLRADLAAGGVVCAFPEAQHDPKQVALLIEGTGVKLGGKLDPSGSSLSYGPELYEGLLTGLAETLGACLADKPAN